MSKHSDKVYILHIIESIEAIERFLKDGKADFLENDMVQNEVLRKLQILSESATRISDERKKLIPEINWRAIAGFRNILVHDYLGDIDMLLVWEHIDKQMPLLKESLQNILPKIRD